jgi:hypothetical protein
MSFPYMNVHVISFNPGRDPAADEDWKIFEMPEEGEIVKVDVTQHGGTIAGNSNSYVTVSILDGGAAGTGTGAMAARGGSGIAWVDATAYTMTITEGTINKGDWIVARWDETGTVSVADLQIAIHVVYGSPAAAGAN